MPAAAAPPTPAETLDETTTLLCHLLPASLSINSFPGRWQVLRSKLATLKSLLSELSYSTHWSENQLLITLLPNLLSTLRRIQTLCDRCTDSTYTAGKLLMQSDLDMAAGWLSKQLHDLDLLLRSGVLRQSNAIVLSQPAPGSAKEDLSLFVRDLFTRLQIGGVEFKRKALESLIQLLVEDEKAATLVAKEGNIGYLINLFDVNTHREQSVSAISILACASDQSRKTVFEEGGLGPLLRIVESGSLPLKEKASMAVEAITADPDNAWAISAYGGVPILLDVCRCGSLTAQSHAIGAIRNVASVEDIRASLGEEAAVPVIVGLLVSGSAAAKEKAANCISILASSGEYFRGMIIQEKGLQKLLQLLHQSSNPDTIEHILRAIHSLSSSDSVSRLLSTSSIFITQISGIIKQGNFTLQQISVSILANLSINDANKRAIAGCMGSLVKLLEFAKPAGLQDSAMKSLVSLLTIKPNRKEFVKASPLAICSSLRLSPARRRLPCEATGRIHSIATTPSHPTTAMMFGRKTSFNRRHRFFFLRKLRTATTQPQASLNGDRNSSGSKGKGNPFLVPGATVATIAMLGALHARRMYSDKKIEEARESGIEPELQPDVKAKFLNMLPLRSISRFWGHLCGKELPVWVRPYAHRAWARAFHSNLEEVGLPLKEYASLKDFAIRRLKDGARPINSDPHTLMSPVDGTVLRVGELKEGVMIEQVKGFSYSVSSLLGARSLLPLMAPPAHEDTSCQQENKLSSKSWWRISLASPKLREEPSSPPSPMKGLFYCVIYLTPGNYHRIHSPVDWNVLVRRHFSGRLYPLHSRAIRTIKNLYVENERVVLEGRWQEGYMAMAAVGATNIGSIELFIEPGLRTNLPRKKLVQSEAPQERVYEPQVMLKKGDEVGAFNMGSTVVLVFQAPTTSPSSEFSFCVEKGDKIQMGEALGRWHQQL